MPMCVLACWHGEPNDAVRWAPPTWRPQGNSSESLLSGRAPSVARIGAKLRNLSGEPDVGAHPPGHHRLLIFLLTVQADLSRDRPPRAPATGLSAAGACPVRPSGWREGTIGRRAHLWP